MKFISYEFFSILTDIANRVRPGRSSVLVGSSITLWCNSQGYTEWFFNVSIPSMVRSLKVYSTEITLHNVSKDDGGHYYCYGTDSTQSERHFIAKSFIKVYGMSLKQQTSFYLVRDLNVQCCYQ